MAVKSKREPGRTFSVRLPKEMIEQIEKLVLADPDRPPFRMVVERLIRRGLARDMLIPGKVKVDGSVTG